MRQLKKIIQNTTEISSETWGKFKIIFSEKELKKGEYFAKEGEYSTKFGFLLTGIIRGFYRSEEGTEYNKTFFISSSFIGAYSSLISGNINYINQEALTDCNILQAEYKDLKIISKNNIELERLSKIIAQNHFINKEKREIELVLLDASDRYKIFKKEYPYLENLIPQYHIASYLGITPTQLSRIRKNNKQQHM